MIVVERKIYKRYLHEKEVSTTFELAQLTGQSPAKMNRLVKESPQRMWIYIPGTQYRFYNKGA